jgi:hypothetical protein
VYLRYTKKLRCTSRSVLRLSGTSTTKTRSGVISAMVEKELGERNFDFDSEVKIETLHGEDAPLFRPLGRVPCKRTDLLQV